MPKHVAVQASCLYVESPSHWRARSPLCSQWLHSMKGPGEFWVSNSLQVSKFFLLAQFVGVEQGPRSLDQIGVCYGIITSLGRGLRLFGICMNNSGVELQIEVWKLCRWEGLNHVSSLVRQVTQDKADDPNPTGEITWEKKCLILGISTFDPST